MDSFEGAVLICDITGFTQLTEQLSKQGPSGVEQLTKCMNNYFTKVCTMSWICFNVEDAVSLLALHNVMHFSQCKRR